MHLTGFALQEYLENEIEHLSSLKFTESELQYLSKLRWLKPDYIEYLRMFHLDSRYINIDYPKNENGEIVLSEPSVWEINYKADVDHTFNMSYRFHLGE